MEDCHRLAVLCQPRWGAALGTPMDCRSHGWGQGSSRLRIYAGIGDPQSDPVPAAHQSTLASRAPLCLTTFRRVSWVIRNLTRRESVGCPTFVANHGQPRHQGGRAGGLGPAAMAQGATCSRDPKYSALLNPSRRATARQDINTWSGATNGQTIKSTPATSCGTRPCFFP